MIAGASAQIGPLHAESPSRRIAGFLEFLRLNGFASGMPEAIDAADILRSTETPLPMETASLALKALLADNEERWGRFDELFDAYWRGRGIKSHPRAPLDRDSDDDAFPAVWKPHFSPAGLKSTVGGVGGAEAEAASENLSKDKARASRREALGRVDLRRLHSPEDQAEAELVAQRLAKAMRYRLARRRRAALRGDSLDLRRTLRRNLSEGGELLDLLWRKRPERPVRVVVMLDVSGSMRLYSRYFMNFLRGLVGHWLESDAYLFHTRLLRVTPALRDGDSLRSFMRLSLMAEGFGGGTRIAGALRTFNDDYAKSVLNSRSVVIIMSDGYDADPPDALAMELKRLKRRAPRLIWLNPLAGWDDFEPTARGMAAALPYVDHFAPAHNLESLAALEPQLQCL